MPPRQQAKPASDVSDHPSIAGTTRSPSPPPLPEITIYLSTRPQRLFPFNITAEKHVNHRSASCNELARQETHLPSPLTPQSGASNPNMADDFSEGRLETFVGKPQKELPGTKDAYVSYLISTEVGLYSYNHALRLYTMPPHSPNMLPTAARRWFDIIHDRV